MARTRKILAAIALHRTAIATYRAASPTGTDPIFAAIEAHCAAIAAYHTASYHDDESSGAAMNHEGDVLCELMSSRPTTMSGVLALCHHLGQPEFLIYGRGGTGMTILQQAMEVAEDQTQAFPLTLADILRDLTGAQSN